MSNIRDVAKEAGVSTATVSRTFTIPTGSHNQTHRRVLEVARRMGYRSRQEKQSCIQDAPNSTAFPIVANTIIGFQFFASGPGDSLSVNDFYGPILQGAEKEATALGLHILLNTTDSWASNGELPRMVQEQMVSGMLLVGGGSAESIAAIAEYVPNIVLVDNTDAVRSFESVVFDSFGGGYAATQYLLSLGHSDRIAFLLPKEDVGTLRDRLRGYVCALFESGVSANPENVLVLSENDWGHKERIASLLDSERRPTAIFCANDYHAHIVMQVCWDKGLKVPDDLSVVGFDDIEFSRYSCPPLTTVQVDKELMGRIAVRRLFAQLNRQEAELSESLLIEPHIIPVTLVVRDSCRAL